jgi:quercetin dioxygenase-like cupin family protein
MILPWKTRVRFWAILFCSLFAAAGEGIPQTSPSPSPSKPQQDRTLFSRSLPKLDGNNIRVTIVEVSYGPGESSKPHSHPCPVIGYVLEGSVRMKVVGEPEAMYNSGESFYEAPNGVHEISANASQTKPAKFIAYFVCDRETSLSIPPVAEKGETR